MNHCFVTGLAQRWATYKGTDTARAKLASAGEVQRCRGRREGLSGFLSLNPRLRTGFWSQGKGSSLEDFEQNPNISPAVNECDLKQESYPRSHCRMPSPAMVLPHDAV